MMTTQIDFKTALTRVRNGENVESVVDYLLDQLTMEERLGLLDGDLPFWRGVKTFLVDGYNKAPIPMGQVKRLGIPGIQFTDGPRGIVMGQSTCFPVSMARGATWDVELEERVGHAIGLEGRAQGANLFAGVCVNLPRHPAWGRIQETYSEDPLLLGDFGAALSRGVRRNLMACVKHFALNSMENARFKVDVQCDEAVMHEVYLPHFKKTIESGGAVAVMSAYNSVRGEFCGQNKLLLDDILRKRWGFTGFVMSDFVFGFNDPVLSLKSGLDVEAPFSHQRSKIFPSALKKGQISDAEIRRSGKRILTQQIKHAIQKDPDEPSADVVFCHSHRALAREVAARSMVLLKNESPVSRTADTRSSHPLLPLNPRQIKKYALIGHLANTANTGDHGSSDVHCPETVTAYQGIQEVASQHSSQIILSPTDDANKASQAALEADVSLVFVGSTAADEGENLTGGSRPSNLPWPSIHQILFDIVPTLWYALTKKLPPNLKQEKSGGSGRGGGGDRKSLHLSPTQIDLIKASDTSNPNTIVIIVGGGAFILDPWITNPRIPAVVYAWYSGSEGGHALADVLFGRSDSDNDNDHDDVAGRLPFCIPRSEEDLPPFTTDANVTSAQYDRWWGQRLLDHLEKPARFPLGFGLSYTTWEVGDVDVDVKHSSSSSTGMKVTVTATVTNTGTTRRGRHVVQIYAVPVPVSVSSSDFPHRVLVGYKPLSKPLSPGHSVRLSVDVDLTPLMRYIVPPFTSSSAAAAAAATGGTGGSINEPNNNNSATATATATEEEKGKFIPITEKAVLEVGGYSGDPAATKIEIRLK